MLFVLAILLSALGANMMIVQTKAGKVYCIGLFEYAVAILLFSLLVFNGYSRAAGAKEEPARPKIGLVLSGGGARGAAHIGVIKVLEELRIPIDTICGTSMGSIVGGLYASGMSIEELETVVTSLDWREALEDLIPRADRSFRRKSEDRSYLVKHKPGLSDDFEIKLPSGLLQGQQIDLILKRLVLPVSSVKNFDNFRIPFRAVATNIVTGKAVVLGSGDLAMAMRASMSVPAAFSAVEIGGKLLVDGGVTNNLPVDVAREMGADIVIAVDISTPLLTRKDLQSSLKITQQLTGILTRTNTEKQIASLAANDLLIVPDLGDISSADFDRADEAIPIGFAAATERKVDLSRLTQSRTTFAAYQRGQENALSRRDPAPPVIDFITLDNNSRLSDEVLLARLKIKKGEPLDVAALEDDIGKIYGLERFENIDYEIVKENGRTGILIHVKGRSWGPNYLQPGITLSSNQDGDGAYTIALAYTRTAINTLDGEWYTAVQIGNTPLLFSEIYQPLDVNSRYFIHPKLFWGKDNVTLFSAGGDRMAEYRVTKYGVDFSAGREFGTWGEARAGIRRLAGEVEIKTGVSGLADYDYDRGELYLRLSVDKIDNLDFPREGYVGSIEYTNSSEDLGADSSFDQILVDWFAAKSWERNTLLAGGRYYSTFDDNAPLQNRFQLGGLFNLSGFIDEELSGQQLGLLRSIYMRRIGDFNLMPTYMGISLEAGNVWEDKDDMAFDDLTLGGSLFVGFDTILGPIYIGYGQAEHNNYSFYFSLGKAF